MRHIAACFDVLELNAGRPHRLNKAAITLAASLGKVLTSNSDSHCGDVGVACNLAPGETAREFLRNIWSGQGTVRSSNMTYHGMLSVVHRMIDSVLDENRSVGLVESMLPRQNQFLELLLLRLVNSRWLQHRSLGREALRFFLKQTSRPAVHCWLRQQHALARRLTADDLLGAQLEPIQRARVA